MNCDLDLNALNFKMLIKKKKKKILASIYYSTLQYSPKPSKQSKASIRNSSLEICKYCACCIWKKHKRQKMWRKTLSALRQPCLSIACRRHSSTNTTVSSAVNSMLLRSLKDHYLEVSKMVPPPVITSLSLSLSLSLTHTHTHTHTHTLRRVLEEGFFILLTN